MGRWPQDSGAYSDLRATTSMGRFKGRLKTLLFRQAFGPALTKLMYLCLVCNKYSVSICPVCKISFCSVHWCCEGRHTNKVLLAYFTPVQPASQSYCKRSLESTSFYGRACISSLTYFPSLHLKVCSVSWRTSTAGLILSIRSSPKKNICPRSKVGSFRILPGRFSSHLKICLETIVSLRRVAARKRE